MPAPLLSSRPFRRRRPRRGGFALVIALSLMAFILLLLLSLSSLLRVETRTSEISKARLLAEQNALLGLQVAIGQLQRYTGPDQVATMTTGYAFGGDLLVPPLPPDDPDPDADPPGTTVNQKHWTGVWTESPVKGQPRHLMWLVSGNENVDPDLPAYQIGPSQQTPLDARPVAANGSLAQGHIWMVDRTVDPDRSGTNQDEKVQVPKVSFESPDGAGAYAFWVADESVKANVALGRPADGTLGTNESEDRVATAQRLNGSVLSGFDGLPTDDDALSVLPNLESIPLLAPAIDEGDLGDRFHDVTVYSKGLLANAREGGLKKDLTAAFEGPDFDSLTAEYGARIFPAVDEDGNEVASTVENPGGPRWEQLRSFVTMRPESGDGTGLNATKQMQTQTETRMGVYPVISSFQLYLTASEVSSTPTEKTVRLWLLPSVSFWNPYNVSIQVPTTYLRITNNRSWQGQDFRFVAWLFDAVDANNPKAALASTVGAPDYPLRFEIDSFTIQPGETLIFSPSSQGVWSNPMGLSRGWLPDNGYYLQATSTAFAPAARFVVGVNDAYPGRQFMEKINLDWTTSDLGPNQVTPGSGIVIQKINSLFGQTAADGRRVYTLNSGYVHPPIYPLQSGNPLSLGKWGYDYRLTFTENSNDFFSTGGVGSNYNVYSRIPWLGVGNPRARFQNISPVEISNESNSAPPSYSYNGGTAALSRIQNDLMYDYEVDFGSGIYNGQVGKRETILFELPQEDTPVLGIGELMHASLSNDRIDNLTDWGSSGGKSAKSVISWVNTAHYLSNDINPAYAVGNSAADPRITSDKLAVNWNGTNFFVTGDPSRNSSASRGWHYDYSYLLNRALWDDFFFSGIPAGGAVPDPLPNSLYEVEDGLPLADLRDFDRAATGLSVAGAFNVNSVSEEAWKAVLAAFLGEAVEVQSGPRSDPDASPLLRLIKPKFDAFDPTVDLLWDDEAYAGFRRLTTAEIDSMATTIVAEFKERRTSIGPFLGLADFINREVEKAGVPVEHRHEGLLQAAIDPIGNAEGDPGSPAGGSWNLNHVFHDADFVIQRPNDTIDNGFGERGFHELAGGVGTQMPEPDHLAGPLAFGAPGFLMQADILARIGNLLTVRGDTFKVRVYGETVDPLTGTVRARVWGEAVVQRTAEYVDTADGPEIFPPANAVNQDFGRRYKLISFQWLDENEV